LKQYYEANSCIKLSVHMELNQNYEEANSCLKLSVHKEYKNIESVFLYAFT